MRTEKATREGTRRAHRDARHGEGYDAFRTGLDFATARQMMWAPEHTPAKWRQKRRRSVLGMWTEIKQQLWAYAQDARERTEETRP